MKTFFSGTLFFVASASAVAAPPAADAKVLSVRIERSLLAARYMEKNCEPVTVAGWEGFETRRCSYEVTDKKTGKKKQGLVVMLNPSALQLSTWIVSACRNVRPTLPLEACSKRVVNRVLSQSGGQFPVAGIVYEDILPADRVNEAYGFRDGVTTVLTGVKHRGVEPLSAQDLEAALTATPLRTASEAGFARIVGVTRDEFKRANPGATVSGLDWLATVRTEYQRAWRSDRNTLMEAWLSSNTP